MNYFKTLFFLSVVLYYNTSYAQNRNSLKVKMDSVEVDIYNNIDVDVPNKIGLDIPPLEIDLNNLPEPTIFIINGEPTKYKKFSEFSTKIEKIDTIEIIKNETDLQKRGLKEYRSAVLITTKINKTST